MRRQRENSRAALTHMWYHQNKNLCWSGEEKFGEALSKIETSFSMDPFTELKILFVKDLIHVCKSRRRGGDANTLIKVNKSADCCCVCTPVTTFMWHPSLRISDLLSVSQCLCLASIIQVCICFTFCLCFNACVC